MSHTKIHPLHIGAFMGIVAVLLALACIPQNAYAATEVEPNDDLSTPTSIPFGSYSTGIISKKDTDCFAIPIPENGSYDLTFVNDDYGRDGGNFGVEIYDTYHDRLGQRLLSPDSTRPETKTYELLKGTAYVKVYWSWWWSNNGEQHQYRIKITPKINPTMITKASGAKKAATVKFTKKIGSSRYEIRYAKSASMRGAKTVNVSAAKGSIKIKKLSKNKKYYFQVRVVKNYYGQDYYSDWSTKAAAKTKR